MVVPGNESNLIDSVPTRKVLKEAGDRWKNFIKSMESSTVDIPSSQWEIFYLKGRNNPDEVEMFMFVHTSTSIFWGEDIVQEATKARNWFKENFCLYFPEYKLEPLDNEAELLSVIKPFKTK